MYCSGEDTSGDIAYPNQTFSDSSQTKPKFNFPPPPRFAKSANNSYCNSSQSDSSNSVISVCTNRKKRNIKARLTKRQPPLGIYWDIENCSVPKSKSASAVVKKIRETFLQNYRESEFVVVCDIKKENPQLIQELHDSQVNLIHVAATSKNAADEKLRQYLRRFAELHPAPSGVVLISGDINFASDLSDLRYRKKLRVILVHNINVADALILCANEHHSFTELTEGLPVGKKTKELGNVPLFVTVSNLPKNIEPARLRNRLELLTDNCGGKCMEIFPTEGIASLKFNNTDLALRAQKRIQGEDVFGNKIKVLSPSVRSFNGRRNKNIGDGSLQSYGAFPPPGFNNQDVLANSTFFSQANIRDPRKNKDINQSIQQEKCSFRPIRGMAPSISPMEVTYDQGWGGTRRADRRPRTPQEHLSIAACTMPIGRIHKTSGSSEFSDDGKVFYSSENSTKNNQSTQPVDLIISNLDPTIEIKELRRLLTNMIKEYAMILNLSIIVQADGTPIANIRVNSQQEAQFTISQLHRQKLGHKRIVISYAQNNLPDPEQLRAMIISVLQEVPDKCMPLFKFMELLESKYHCTVSVSEVNKLKDTVKITDDLGSRIISLTQELKVSPPPNLSKTLLPYCISHCPNGFQNRGWCEISTIQTPNVMVCLSLFASKLMDLLNRHMGVMPLLSFQICYEQEFHEPLPVVESGVPLEHLISCVSNVEIKFVGPNKNIKVIRHEVRNSESEEEVVLKSVAPSLAPNINLFCRELVDLLKTTEKCQLFLTKFIPAYHHHFGRQCRVADYGYTKLLDLLEAISHVVQIMGDGTRRIITLTHSAQMRRFTSDLLRVLKVQPSKQISIKDFPNAYEKVMNKAFNAVEYGLCMFEDLLREVPDNTIVINRQEGDIVISVPKREQTAEEIMRTKQFAAEVIDLLRHTPNYTMLFNKYVPAYHHHFGHQCKVSDYGFTKLIELFEAIPDVVKIEELPDGERTISLTIQQSLKILGSQLLQIIKASKMSSVKLDELPILYIREYGYPLTPQTYDCNTISEVLRKLSDYVQVIHSNAGTLLIAVEMDSVPNILRVRCWALLLNPPHCKDLNVFKYQYYTCYNSSYSSDVLREITDYISISISNQTEYISLKALYILATQLYHVISNSGGGVLYSNLEKLYFDTYGKPLNLPSYHINSVEDFYTHFNLLFFIRGNKRKSVVVLNRNLTDHLVPLAVLGNNSSQYENENKNKNVNWPPPPPTEMVQNTMKKVSPPKPDTPPTPGTHIWSHWSTPSKFDNDMSLSIQMPITHNPTLMGNPEGLISPAHHLLPISRNPWNNDHSGMAPDPTELPMPDKLLFKEGASDDSADSGVNIKLETSPSDNDLDSCTSERRYRAAQRSLWNIFEPQQ